MIGKHNISGSYLNSGFVRLWGAEVNYTGTSRNGLAHGYGRAFVRGKDNGGLLVFSGYWNYGDMEGQGLMENRKTGYRYTGKWRNGQPNGNGTETDPEGSRTAEGQFKDGKLNGYGAANFSWCGKLYRNIHDLYI